MIFLEGILNTVSYTHLGQVNQRRMAKTNNVRKMHISVAALEYVKRNSKERCKQSEQAARGRDRSRPRHENPNVLSKSREIGM